MQLCMIWYVLKSLLSGARVHNKVKLLNICKQKRFMYNICSLCHSGLERRERTTEVQPLSLPLSWPRLSRNFHNLQNLSLAYCRKFTDKGLQYLNLGKGCHKLIYLDLSGCTQVCLSVSPSLQQASVSSGGRAACSPHVPQMLCTAARSSTLCRGFKLHGWPRPPQLSSGLLL